MSATERRRPRRGFTLVESMMASVLLAFSVVGVSGVILSSYAHDRQSIARRDAVAAANALMSELTALPFVAGSATDVGLTDFSSYSDTTTSSNGKSATAQAAQNKGKTTAAATASGQAGLVSGVLGLVNGLLGGSSSNAHVHNSGSPTPAATTPAPTVTTTVPATTASRTVTVYRENTINGPSTPTGDLAVVTVDASIGDGQVIRIRRLVSSTEAESTVAK